MNEKRIVFLDWLRVSACFLVILTAAISHLLGKIPVIGKYIVG